MNRWRSLLALPSGEIRLLATATAAVLMSAIVLRVLPAVAVRRLVQRKGAPHSDKAKWAPEQLARFVEIANRHVPGTPSCLRRTVALSYLFRRHGFPATFSIGVQREKDTLYAHAWLQTDNGATYGLPDEPTYSLLSHPATVSRTYVASVAREP